MPRRPPAPAPDAPAADTTSSAAAPDNKTDPLGRPDLHPGALAHDPPKCGRFDEIIMRSSTVQSYPSNASADPRLARDTSVASGSGSALPVSRNLLVMG